MRSKMIWVVMGFGIFVNLLVLPVFILPETTCGVIYAGCPSYQVWFLKQREVISVNAQKAAECGIKPAVEEEGRPNLGENREIARYVLRHAATHINWAMWIGCVANLVLLIWMGLIASANKKPAS